MTASALTSSIAYNLRVALQADNIHNVQCEIVENPSMVVAFERRTEGTLVLDSWVDAEGLTGTANSLEAVCTSGFQFPASGQGAVFSTGRIDVPEPAVGRTYTFLLCKIAVGKSVVIESESTDAVLPRGADSLCVARSAEDEDRGYYYEYVLMDSSQVLPYAVVSFQLGKSALATAPPGSPTADLRVSWDLLERKIQALKAGGSGGEGGISLRDLHVVVHKEIEDGHAAAVAAAALPDPLLEDDRSKIEESLALIDDRARELNLAHAAAEEEVYAKLQATLDALRADTEAKRATLASHEHELRRQVGQLQDAEAFLEVRAHEAEHGEFVLDWEAHRKLRHDLHRQRMVNAASTLSVISVAITAPRVAGEVTIVSSGEGGNVAAAAPAASPAAIADRAAAVGVGGAGGGGAGEESMGSMWDQRWAKHTSVTTGLE